MRFTEILLLFCVDLATAGCPLRGDTEAMSELLSSAWSYLSGGGGAAEVGSGGGSRFVGQVVDIGGGNKLRVKKVIAEGMDLLASCGLSVSIHTHTHTHTGTHIHAHTHTHARTHTHMHARTHIHTHTHIHAHTHTHTRIPVPMVSGMPYSPYKLRAIVLDSRFIHTYMCIHDRATP